VLLENWISACREQKLNSCISPYTNTNSKLIKYLNIRPETLKQVQERVGNSLELIGIGNNFLNINPMPWQLRELTDNETKNLLYSKINGHQIEEAAHRMGENLCL
jgi:hypothetical protein